MARAAKKTTATKAKAGPQRTKAGTWNETKERRELRKKLQARLKEILNASSVPERGRGSFIATVTHRSKQAVALWLDPAGSGLPDVIALRQLALAFNVDPAYLLGLTKVPRRPGQISSDDGSYSHARADWLDSIDDELRRRAGTAQSFVMDSDEMEPTIRRGALVLVNGEATTPTHSGPYAVEAAGRITVRMIEARLGGGLVLRCDNNRYADPLTVAKEADLKKHAVRIVGKVVGWLDASWK